jgi:DNA uptake protein ComE-like DNA-binding protein
MRFAFLVVVALALAAPAFGQARPAPTPAASLIDLNSASRDSLMTLEGIGEVRADAVIRTRPFKAKTELVERHIIPEHLYEKLADKVTVRPLPGAAPTTPAKRP